VNPDPLFWLAICSLAVTCLAAIGAGSLTEFSPDELKEICRRRKSPDRLGQILRRHDQVALAAEILRVASAAVFVGAGMFWVCARIPGDHLAGAVTIASALATGAVLLLAVEIWIPRPVVRLWAAPLLHYTWKFWLGIAILAWPLLLATRFVDTLLHRLAGRTAELPDEESFEEQIRAIVTEGHREGFLEADAREMIKGVIELGDADTSEVMTPRTDMVSMPLALSWQDTLDFVVKVGHTRIPVYDKNLDDIVGVLYAKDLLPQLAKESTDARLPLTALLREPYFVPETKPIDVLLQEFQKTRNHMAVVLDEYGGVSGLVTMEDILEEIVGEIVDEYDKDLVEGIRQLGEGRCEALAKVHIDEINERLGLSLPDDGDFDTIGGLVFSQLGHIPSVGEQLVLDKVKLTVLDATARRIERVRIEILDDTLGEV
jgi:CBS domain containing-hemolysin-like protein